MWRGSVERAGGGRVPGGRAGAHGGGVRLPAQQPASQAARAR